MRVDEFDYSLPPSLIAQYPATQRGGSRLMVLHRGRGTIDHRRFGDILAYLDSGDLLVMNNTRVLPARLIGKKESGGKCEILLIPSWNGNKGKWNALIKGSSRVKPGTRIQFGDDLYGEVKEVKDGRAEISFSSPGEVMEAIQRVGHVPLPPYIRRPDEPMDRDRYQTIFAERDGSIASPTAGLHFTRELFESLRNKGLNLTFITLHIGVGTFAPVKVEEVEDHRMEEEWIEISEQTAKEIEVTKQRGRRVIAVGTTTTKALESFSDLEGRVKPGRKVSSLFIHPPYDFRVVDGLITNFHLPRSTLLMLVSAFTGKDLLMKAYEEAIEKGYRFYSYGDAMLIL
ncbi:MAG: tRNA preQ1(34) S-adenosylmethionine ribosyltransferase-isomerase QueA [Syntrophaceae bacterium]|nr:tRNA preQ1(34) S-adenosylmethionine ribosyltransferase-isomerase QueA [Syntrophaceae bacterium]